MAYELQENGFANIRGKFTLESGVTIIDTPGMREVKTIYSLKKRR